MMSDARRALLLGRIGSRSRGLLVVLIALAAAGGTTGCSSLDGGTSFYTAVESQPRFVAATPTAKRPGQVERIALAGDGGADSSEKNLFVARCVGAEKQIIKQAYDQWCWAACVAMVLRYEGVDRNADQMNIAGHFGNHDEQQAVDPETVVRALSPELKKRLDEEVYFIPSLPRPNSTTLVQEILQGHPVIMGLRDSPDALEGHTYLAYEVTFREVAPPKFLGLIEFEPDTPLYLIEEAALIDPISGEIVRKSGQELRDCTDFLVSRSMSRALLREAIRNARRRA